MQQWVTPELLGRHRIIEALAIPAVQYVRKPKTISEKEEYMEVGDAKQMVLEAIGELPPDATVEDAIERLYFLAKIQKGIEQAAAGRTVSHEEAKKRLLGG